MGPFDADLGAYYEDVDWGFRARLQGLTICYVPTAVAYHIGSATTGREGKRYALATQCIGGGQGIATILEAV